MLLSAGFTIQGLVCAAPLRPVRGEKASIANVSHDGSVGNGVCDSDDVDKKRQQSKWKGIGLLLVETFDLSL